MSNTPPTPPPAPLRRAPYGSRPSWRHGFASTADADHFWDLLIDSIPDHLGPIERVDRDDGSVTLATGAVVFVANPARDIQDVARSEWSAYAHWWLDKLRLNQPTAINELITSWNRVKGLLRLRLLPVAEPETTLTTNLTRSLAWGVAIAIPGGSTPAPPDSLTRWNTSERAVWSRARNNTRRIVVVERTDVIAMERHLRLIEGDLFATGALDNLGTVVPEIGSQGALIVAPTSNSFLVQPIDGWHDVAEDAARILVAALQFQQLGSHPLPLALLWYRAPGELVGAAEFTATDSSRPFSLRTLAPEPLRTALDHGP